MSYFTKILRRLGIITFITITPTLTAWHSPISSSTINSIKISNIPATNYQNNDQVVAKVPTERMITRTPARPQKIAANVYDVSTQTGIKQMVGAHNSWRKRTGVAPLSWSPRLASFAQEWANTLAARDEFRHRDNNNYGENLAASQGKSLSPNGVVWLWGEEVKDYDYKTNSCKSGEMCGHYTQLVWHKTKEVGCAKAETGNKEVWVCNYNPPGNYRGQKPY